MLTDLLRKCAVFFHGLEGALQGFYGECGAVIECTPIPLFCVFCEETDRMEARWRIIGRNRGGKDIRLFCCAAHKNELDSHSHWIMNNLSLLYNLEQWSVRSLDI